MISKYLYTHVYISVSAILMHLKIPFHNILSTTSTEEALRNSINVITALY